MSAPRELTNKGEVKSEKVMKLKYVTDVVKRDGKYFVSVYTPLGPTNVDAPTSFQPDDENEVGPFDSEGEAEKEQKGIEAELNKNGQRWMPPAEFKAWKKAKNKAREEATNNQKRLF